MKRVEYYMNLAAQIAVKFDNRNFAIGSVGVRHDGVIVASRNSPVIGPCRSAHAEYRVSRKIDIGAIIYVVRILRTGGRAIARPCDDCRKALISKGAKKVYYSINAHEYGVMQLT